MKQKDYKEQCEICGGHELDCRCGDLVTALKEIRTEQSKLSPHPMEAWTKSWHIADKALSSLEGEEEL